MYAACRRHAITLNDVITATLLRCHADAATRHAIFRRHTPYDAVCRCLRHAAAYASFTIRLFITLRKMLPFADARLRHDAELSLMSC